MSFDPELPPAKRRDAEYYFMQDMVSKFNADCLAVKQWSVTSASLVAVVGQANRAAYEAVAAIVALLSLAFWLTETVWRRNQFAFILRIHEIEAKDRDGPQISSQWSQHYLGTAVKTLPVDWRVFFLPQTYLPHGLILAASGLVFVVAIACPEWLPHNGLDKTPQQIVVEKPVQIQQVR